MMHKKIETLSVTSLKHICKTKLIQVMPFLNSNLFQKYTGCHGVAVESLFWRPKMERNYLFRESSV